MCKDNLGDRIKKQYENRTRYYLPRRTYTIIRLDGNAFHTYTRNLEKPFDALFITDMNETAQFLVNKIQGTSFAYVQSDEISLLLTDFNNTKTDAWFDGNIQKIVSISASMATAKFNRLRPHKIRMPRSNDELAFFDSRAFTIPDPVEVENYFIWRQKDWIRNSLQMVARSHYSHKELLNKNTQELHELIYKANDNWTNYLPIEKNGAVVTKDDITGTIEFTKNREFIRKQLIPTHGYENKD